MAKKWAQITAIIALLCIIASVVWTWVLMIFSKNDNQTTELTPEQLEQLQQIINESLESETESWEIVDENIIDENIIIEEN